MAKDRLNHLKNIFYLYRQIYKFDKLYLFLSCLMILIDVIIPFNMTIFMKLAIDELTAGKDFMRMVMYILGMACINFILNSSQAILDGYNNKKIEEIKTNFLYCIQSKAMCINYIDLENANVIDQFKKAIEVFYPTQAQFMDLKNTINGVRDLVTSIVKGILCIYILFSIHPLVFIGVIVITLITTVLNTYAADKEHEVWDNSLVKVGRKLAYWQQVSTDYTYAKEVRVYQLSSWVANKMYGISQEIIKMIMQAIYLFTGTSIVSNTLKNIQDIGIYIYITSLVFKRKITIGDFTLYINLVTQFVSALISISNNVVLLDKSGIYFNAFIKCMLLPEPNKEENNIYLENIEDNFSIKFEHVSFRYPNMEKNILEDVCFEIKQGEKVALVGDNGAGKSTLIKLLMRLYKPTKGTIYLNGIDIQELEYYQYNSIIAAVFQELQVFNFTLGENIVLSDNQVNMKKLKEVIEMSGMKEDIEKLPYQLDTYMFKGFDTEGVELSGGQQQKLALARALYKSFEMIILDEPTAMLSPKAEYELYSTFNQIVKGKTALYISHRMSSCKFCNKILVLNEGIIQASGTHDELINQDGLYAEMYFAQAQFYA